MPTKNQTRDFMRKVRIEHDARIQDSLDNIEYELPPATTEQLGGVKVGDGLTINNDGTLNVTIENYELPTASETVKGGVKVGSGLSMNGETLSANLTADNLPTASTTSGGIMSAADKAKLDSLNNYTLPTASASTKGGVKVGSGLSMNGETLNVDTDYILEHVDLPIASETVKGGIKVGNGLYMNDETLNVDTEAVGKSVILPTASETTKGAVKVGNGLYMNGDNLMLDLPTASKTTKGGVRIGSGLVMNGNILNVDLTGTLVLAEDGAAVSSVEGGLWVDEYDNKPTLQLRFGDYKYLFYYDSYIGSTTLPKDYIISESMQYVLKTVPSSVQQGELWMTPPSADLTQYPTINFNAGGGVFSIVPDSLAYVGDRANLICWFPLDTNFNDVCGRGSMTNGAAANVVYVDDPTAFNGRCATVTTTSWSVGLPTGSDLTLGTGEAGFYTVEFWVKIPGTSKNNGWDARVANLAVCISVWPGSTAEADVYIVQLRATSNSSMIKEVKLNEAQGAKDVHGWHHWAIITDQTQYNVYKDGELFWTNGKAAGAGVAKTTANVHCTGTKECPNYLQHVRIWKGIHWPLDKIFAVPVASDYDIM